MALRTALLQLRPGDSLEEQLRLGQAACRRAKAIGAHIALFPEMWSDGYRIPQEAEALEALAIAREDPFVEPFGQRAEELGMAIGITFLEKHRPRPRNSLVLYDRRGQAVLRCSKVHTCGFSLERMLDPGDGFQAAGLDLDGESLRVGSMICFDREFPESARVLMRMGAEVVLAPNACPMELNRLAALRTRAYENKMAIATCNDPKGVPDCNGRSTVFDGAAWRREEPGSRDMCTLEAPEDRPGSAADVPGRGGPGGSLAASGDLWPADRPVSGEQRQNMR